ncbi:radical SAM protein [Geoglobus sp.]
MLDAETKLKLLIYGVRADRRPLRRGGGGPTGGLGFRIGESVVSAPVLQSYARNSPFVIEKKDEDYHLAYSGETIGTVEFPKAEYYDQTIDGISAGRIVALDGYDTLVSAVSRKCVHWQNGMRCSFCSIQQNLSGAVADKNPEQVARAVRVAYEEDRNRHLTLTTGTAPTPDKGAVRLAEVVKAVKAEVDIPVHVQVEPVGREFLELLYESGADSIGIHVETFDPLLRKRVVPGKPGVDEYLKSWSAAVDVFGEWNVSSWLLTGLGESRESIIHGLKTMLEHAVYPFIVPYRPPPFTSSSSPDIRYQLSVLRDVKETLSDSEETVPRFRSGCPRCNGCSFVGELL